MKRSRIYMLALGLLLSMVFTANGLRGTAQAVVDDTPDCDNVAIIRCGAMTLDGLRQKYDANTYGDLPAVFSAFGISRADIYGGNWQNGIVWRDGRVTVDGKVVARSAMTAGRNYGGTPIPGTNNVGKYPTSKFVTEGQTAFVKMINGKFQFAVIKSCSNPVSAEPTAEPPKPVYACKSLSAEKISRAEFRFNATATAENGARIDSYKFNFGDGKTETSTDSRIRHTYAKPGDYTVRVTAVFVVDGKKVEKTSANCVVKVTVNPAPIVDKPGVEVIKTVDGVERKTVNLDQVFTYQLVVKNTGNVELKNTVVTDKAPTGVVLLSTSHGTITDNKLTYTVPSLAVGKSMTISLKAKVPTYLAGTIKNTVCVDNPQVPGNPDDCDTADVDVPKPGNVQVCDPATGKIITVPEGEKDKYKPIDDPACQPADRIKVCELETGEIITIDKDDFDEELHTTDLTQCEEEPEAPEVLAATGPTEILSGLFGTSALGYGGYSYLQSRRDLIRKLLGR